LGEARCLPQNAAHAACGKLTRAVAAMAPALEEAGAGIGSSLCRWISPPMTASM